MFFLKPTNLEGLFTEDFDFTPRCYRNVHWRHDKSSATILGGAVVQKLEQTLASESYASHCVYATAITGAEENASVIHFSGLFLGEFYKNVAKFSVSNANCRTS
jgi:hypothetical protein